MSAVVRPSGPLPARVYWVRRMLALVIVLVVGWALVRVLGGGGDPANGEPQAADPGTQATDEPDDPAAAQTPAPGTNEQGARGKHAGRRQQVQTVSQTVQSPSGPCDLTLVRVAPEVSQPAYVNTAVTLRIALTTTQATACTLELDAERLLVAVSSDEVTVWSSTECPDAVPTRDLVLRPYWTSTVDISWSGQRSVRRCASDAAFAPPGEYQLEVAALTGEPGSAAFTLDPEPVQPRSEEDEPADEQPADEQPADEQPADEQPGDEQPADDEPADEQPADDQPADDTEEQPPAG